MDQGRQGWFCLDPLPMDILRHAEALAMMERWREMQTDKQLQGFPTFLRENPYSSQIPGLQNVRPHRSL
jgi:hypothetical protein